MGKETFDAIIGIANILILGITCYFIYRSIYSPVDAVKIGRDLNKEQQKDNAKRNLFLTLFSLRGSPVHYDFVRGLNEIDVVFEDVPTVLTAWHNLYDSLQIKEQANAEKTWELLRVELLSAMAVSLGYSRIRPTDMIREYYPEGHGFQAKEDWDFRQANLTFLKSGAAFHQLIIEYLDKLPPALPEQKD